MRRTVEFSFNLFLPSPIYSSFLTFCCRKLHVCFYGHQYYGDLDKQINCRIPRTSKTRGNDSKNQTRNRCCSWSLTGFLSAVFFFLLPLIRAGEEKLPSGLQTLLFGCMDLQKGSTSSRLSSLVLVLILTGQIKKGFLCCSWIQMHLT